MMSKSHKCHIALNLALLKILLYTVIDERRKSVVNALTYIEVNAWP